MEKRKKFILPENELPTKWYNIVADMPNKPMPMLHPGTREPIKAEDLYPIFAKGLADQELNQTDAWIWGSKSPGCSRKNSNKPSDLRLYVLTDLKKR
jgi:predicted alternative tryptophan synthase beta-subunit